MASCIRVGEGEPLIDPYRYKRGELPYSRVLMVFTPRLFRLALRALDDWVEIRFSDVLYRVVVGSYRGVDIVLALPYWGAPAAAAGFEKLIAGGGQVFIMVGLAGAVSPVARIGDILVPSWGLREEGTSYHYMPPEYVPHPDGRLAEGLYRAIRRVKGRRRIRVLRGGIWSIDAIYRETRDKVLEYSRRGVIGVDMEATALMTIAEYRGVSIAVASAISDELYGEEWKPGFDSPRLRRAERISIVSALEVLSGTVRGE